MIPPTEYLRSVEWVVAAGAASGLALLVSLIACRRSLRPLIQVVRGEDGAANSAAHVMVLPFYVLIVCVLLECTQLFLAKMGTVYAAYAAARSAAVWQSAEAGDAGAGRGQPRVAAVYAMAPFASAQSRHSAGDLPSITPEDDRSALRRLFKDADKRRVARAKLRHAERALQVEVAPVALPGPEDRLGQEGLVRATVTYEAPFYTPVVGRWFGRRPTAGGRHHVLRIVSQVELPDEAPRNATRSLGVRYVSTP